MKTASLFAMLLLIAPLALAQEPTTQPIRKIRPDRGERAPEGQFDRDGHDRPGPRMFERRDEETDWSEVERFLETNSPNRWAAFKNLAPEQQQRLRRFILPRIRVLLRDDDEFMELRKQQIRIEDQMFGLVQQIRSADQPDPLKEQLRETVRQLVELRMKERELRIARLRMAVQEETQRLQQDQQNMEQIVEQRMREQLAGEGNALVPEPRKFPPRRGEGEERRHPDEPPPPPPVE